MTKRCIFPVFTNFSEYFTRSEIIRNYPGETNKILDFSFQKYAEIHVFLINESLYFYKKFNKKSLSEKQNPLKTG